MNTEVIQLWWEVVPKPKEMVQLIRDSLLQSKMIVINDAQKIPWAHEFKQLICHPLREDGGNEMYCSIDHEIEDIRDVGEYLFDKYESESRKLQFRPINDYSTFLGQSLDAPLHQKLIWVKCLKSEKQLSEWMNFIHFYTKARQKVIQDSHRKLPICRFVLELDSSLKKTKAYATLKISFKKNAVFTYSMDYLNNFTLHVFATSLLEKKLYSSKYSIKNKYIYYTADLAADLADGNPELCSELLAQPRLLLNNPKKHYQTIIKNFPLEKTFSKVTGNSDQIREICWRNQVSHLFPVIEKIRQYFLLKNWEEYSKLLPREDLKTKRIITPPLELEIGVLRRLANNPYWKVKDHIQELKISYSQKDIDLLNLAAKSRNSLAHQKVVGLSEVKKLLDWHED